MFIIEIYEGWGEDERRLETIRLSVGTLDEARWTATLRMQDKWHAKQDGIVRAKIYPWGGPYARVIISN